MTNPQTRPPAALPPAVRRATGTGGLPTLEIESRLATAQIYLQGAHVAAWQPRAALAPVLWISRESEFAAGRPIRGGVPVCFPWFAAHATDRAAPSHGFARISEWTLTGASEGTDGTVEVELTLASDRPLSPAWPHPFRAVHRVSVGSSLTMALEVHNPGAAPITFEEALHTYFAVQDVRAVSVTGLEQTAYLDKVAAFARRTEGDAPIRITAETDRIYLQTRATCAIDDPGKRRRITVAKSGSEATVLWNPWIDRARAIPDFGDLEWPEMLCIETANVNAHAVTLAPGATHTMTATLSVAPLG